MTHEHLATFRKAMSETNTLDDFSQRQLKEHLRKFSDLLVGLGDTGEILKCHDRMEAIRQEIERLRIEKTLKWARIGGVTAIVTGLVAVASLIYQIYFAKVPPSTSQQSSPQSSLQSQSPTNASPEPEASSNTSTPSPEQAVTAAPLPSQPER